MSPVELQAELRKRPFVPFRMYLSDGTVYEIRHPELVMAGMTTANIGFATDPNQTYYNSYTVVSLLHVVRLEPVRAQCGRDQRPGRLTFAVPAGGAITRAWRWRRRRRTAAPSSRRWCTPTASRRLASRRLRRRPSMSASR